MWFSGQFFFLLSVQVALLNTKKKKKKKTVTIIIVHARSDPNNMQVRPVLFKSPKLQGI